MHLLPQLMRLKSQYLFRFCVSRFFLEGLNAGSCVGVWRKTFFHLFISWRERAPSFAKIKGYYLYFRRSIRYLTLGFLCFRLDSPSVFQDRKSHPMKIFADEYRMRTTAGRVCGKERLVVAREIEEGGVSSKAEILAFGCGSTNRRGGEKPRFCQGGSAQDSLRGFSVRVESLDLCRMFSTSPDR